MADGLVKDLGGIVAIRVDFEGVPHYVQLTATTLVGVAASDGKLLWRYDPASNTHRINCTTPIYHDGMGIAASAYDAGGGAVKLEKDSSGALEAKEVFFSSHMKNHHGGMIVSGDCLYGTAGGNRGGFLVCFDVRPETKGPVLGFRGRRGDEIPAPVEGRRGVVTQPYAGPGRAVDSQEASA